MYYAIKYYEKWNCLKKLHSNIKYDSITLDSDLKKELNDRCVKKDRSLDLSTELGRLAIQLSKGG
jgi:hypothetical protein